MAKKKDNKAALASAEAPKAARLKARYEEAVRAGIAEKFGLENPMQMPRLDGTKIPVSVREAVIHTLTTISGQKPIMIRAKKSVSNFKLREGYESAYMVTLRRDRMWHFLDRLVNLATPRIKDFRGLSRKAFDRQGNYSMGLTEQGVFPEINMAEQNFTHGMNINMVFRNSNREMSEFVLEELGMPFKKLDEKAGH
jgi:large subunit ribosomal protein L5